MAARALVRYPVVLWLALVVGGGGVWLSGALGAQSSTGRPDDPRPRRPALIRDDQTLQPDPVAAGLEEPPDPAKAGQHFEIGQFYLKQKRYDAALMRFREAVRNRPDFAEAKWAFVETLSRKGDWENVVEFATNYLSDPTMTEYGKRLEQSRDRARKRLERAGRGRSDGP